MNMFDKLRKKFQKTKTVSQYGKDEYGILVRTKDYLMEKESIIKEIIHEEINKVFGDSIETKKVVSENYNHIVEFEPVSRGIEFGPETQGTIRNIGRFLVAEAHDLNQITVKDMKAILPNGEFEVLLAQGMISEISAQAAVDVSRSLYSDISENDFNQFRRIGSFQRASNLKLLVENVCDSLWLEDNSFPSIRDVVTCSVDKVVEAVCGKLGVSKDAFIKEQQELPPKKRFF
jgi:hypothetical protein